MIRICLDAGHGGYDPGAISNNVKEKEITIGIATRTKQILEYEFKNIVVNMTRDSDQTVSLPTRVKLANATNSHGFISIHINAATNPQAEGFETFTYLKASEESKKMCEIIHNNLKGFFDKDRGMKTKDLFVLRETRMPAVLIEFGFITNFKERAKLKNEMFIHGCAIGLAKAISEHFKLEQK